MENRRWRNQYIDLMGSKPEYIVNATGKSLDAAGLEQIRTRIGRYQAVAVEIGSGSGQHLIELARRDPNTLYIGYEIRFKRIFRTAEKAEKLGLENILLVRQSAFEMPETFGSESLAAVYINFPDPWDKKRWHKNRILNPDFIKAIHGMLKPDGFLSYKTDHAGYFAATRAILDALQIFYIEALENDLHNSPLAEATPPTEFESLFRSKGLPVMYLHAKKIGRLENPRV
jgi:tRNA (guanine-N7-)-methyltransferase